MAGESRAYRAGRGLREAARSIGEAERLRAEGELARRQELTGAAARVAGEFSEGLRGGVIEPVPPAGSPFARSGLVDLGPGAPPAGRVIEPVPRSAAVTASSAEAAGSGRLVTPFARSGLVDLGPGAPPAGRVIEPVPRSAAVTASSAEAAGSGRLVTPFARSALADLGPGTAPAGEGPRRALAPAAAPRGPVAEGIVMRRGMPGSGEYGERRDLNPVRLARQDPMSVAEGVRAGIVEVYRPGEAQRQADRVTADQMSLMPQVKAMREARDRAMEMTSPAAARLRQSMKEGTAASGPRRATGRNPSTARLERVARAGMAFDAATGQWVNVALEDVRGREGAARERNRLDAAVEAARLANDTRRVGIEETNAGPKGLDRLNADDVLGGLARFGKPKPMTPDDLQRSDPGRYAQWAQERDPAKKSAFLEVPWREDDRAAYEQYYREAVRRGLVGGGGGKGEGGRRKEEGGGRNWRERMG